MSTKSTVLLVAVAALLFGFIFFVERPFRAAAQIPNDQTVLPGLNPAKITAVEIQVGGSAQIIRAEKTKEGWELTQSVPYPAAGHLIEKLLQELAQWEWQSVIDHPSSWEEYGLLKDQFTLTLQQGEEQRALKIGDLSPVGDKVYLNVPGGHQVFVASPELLKLIPNNDVQWRDLTVLNLNGTDFRKLQVHAPAGNLTLALELNAAGLWRMTVPIDARADTAKINGWLGRLQAMMVRGFAPDDTQETNATGVAGPVQTQQLILTFLHDTSETNKALELRAGGSPVNWTNLAWARRLSPPGLIAIEKGPLLPWESDYTNFLDRRLISVSPGLISSIEVEGADIEKFNAQKTEDGSWRITCTNGETFPADAALMKEWLSALTNIQVVAGRSPAADKVPYGLDQPAGALLHYQVYYAGPASQTNQAMTDLLFGLGTNHPSQIFEMGNDEITVNTIDEEQFYRLPRAYWELRERAIWHFESNEVTAIDIQQEGVHVRYTRDAQNQWTVPRETTLVPFQAGIEEALYRMGRLEAEYWRGYGDDHLERFGFDKTDYRISFEIKRDGQLATNAIQFGAASPYLHPYASVMRDGRRLVFEFPVDLYANLVAPYLSAPAHSRRRQ